MMNAKSGTAESPLTSTPVNIAPHKRRSGTGRKRMSVIGVTFLKEMLALTGQLVVLICQRSQGAR
jgi:hypothetical protein